MRLSSLVVVLIAAVSVPGQRPSEDGRPRNSWAEYGGGADSAQYSDLSQINRENVKRLRLVWRYPTGDSGEYLFNPIVVHGVMYMLAKQNSNVALEAKTGKELWEHETDPNTSLITKSGINYWESPDGRERRLFFACNNILQAIVFGLE